MVAFFWPCDMDDPMWELNTSDPFGTQKNLLVSLHSIFAKMLRMPSSRLFVLRTW